MSAEIRTITVVHNMDKDSMYGSDGPEDGVNVSASESQFETLVSDAIKGQYPTAAVEFKTGNGMGTKILVNGDDHPDSEYIGWKIYHEVWESWDWVVYDS